MITNKDSYLAKQKKATTKSPSSQANTVYIKPTDYAKSVNRYKQYKTGNVAYNNVARLVADLRINGASDDEYRVVANAMKDPGSNYYNPYFGGKSTQTAAIDFFKGFTGADNLTLDDDFFNAYQGLRSYAKRSPTTGTLLTPTAKDDQNVWAAYYYENLLADKNTSIKANNEWSELRNNSAQWFKDYEAVYGRKPSVDEYLNSVDISKYGTLYSMDASRNIGTDKSSKVTQLNDGCFYSNESLYGLYHALANGKDVSEDRDYFEDAVQHFVSYETPNVENVSWGSADLTGVTEDEYNKSLDYYLSIGDMENYEGLKRSYWVQNTPHMDGIDTTDYLSDRFGYYHDDAWFEAAGQVYEPILAQMETDPESGSYKKPSASDGLIYKAAYQYQQEKSKKEYTDAVEAELTTVMSLIDAAAVDSVDGEDEKAFKDYISTYIFDPEDNEYPNLSKYLNGDTNTCRTLFASIDGIDSYISEAYRNGGHKKTETTFTEEDIDKLVAPSVAGSAVAPALYGENQVRLAKDDYEERISNLNTLSGVIASLASVKAVVSSDLVNNINFLPDQDIGAPADEIASSLAKLWRSANPEGDGTDGISTVITKNSGQDDGTPLTINSVSSLIGAYDAAALTGQAPSLFEGIMNTAIKDVNGLRAAINDAESNSRMFSLNGDSTFNLATYNAMYKRAVANGDSSEDASRIALFASTSGSTQNTFSTPELQIASEAVDKDVTEDEGYLDAVGYVAPIADKLATDAFGEQDSEELPTPDELALMNDLQQALVFGLTGASSPKYQQCTQQFIQDLNDGLIASEDVKSAIKEPQDTVDSEAAFAALKPSEKIQSYADEVSKLSTDPTFELSDRVKSFIGYDMAVRSYGDIIGGTVDEGSPDFKEYLANYAQTKVKETQAFIESNYSPEMEIYSSENNDTSIHDQINSYATKGYGRNGGAYDYSKKTVLESGVTDFLAVTASAYTNKPNSDEWRWTNLYNNYGKWFSYDEMAEIGNALQSGMISYNNAEDIVMNRVNRYPLDFVNAIDKDDEITSALDTARNSIAQIQDDIDAMVNYESYTGVAPEISQQFIENYNSGVSADILSGSYGDVLEQIHYNDLKNQYGGDTDGLNQAVNDAVASLGNAAQETAPVTEYTLGDVESYRNLIDLSEKLGPIAHTIFSDPESFKQIADANGYDFSNISNPNSLMSELTDGAWDDVYGNEGVGFITSANRGMLQGLTQVLTTPLGLNHMRISATDAILGTSIGDKRDGYETYQKEKSYVSDKLTTQGTAADQFTANIISEVTRNMATGAMGASLKAAVEPSMINLISGTVPTTIKSANAFVDACLQAQNYSSAADILSHVPFASGVLSSSFYEQEQKVAAAGGDNKDLGTFLHSALRAGVSTMVELFTEDAAVEHAYDAVASAVGFNPIKMSSSILDKVVRLVQDSGKEISQELMSNAFDNVFNAAENMDAGVANGTITNIGGLWNAVKDAYKGAAAEDFNTAISTFFITILGGAVSNTSNSLTSILLDEQNSNGGIMSVDDLDILLKSIVDDYNASQASNENTEENSPEGVAATSDVSEQEQAFTEAVASALKAENSLDALRKAISDLRNTVAATNAADTSSTTEGDKMDAQTEESSKVPSTASDDATSENNDVQENESDEANDVNPVTDYMNTAKADKERAVVEKAAETETEATIAEDPEIKAANSDIQQKNDEIDDLKADIDANQKKVQQMSKSQELVYRAAADEGVDFKSSSVVNSIHALSEQISAVQSKIAASQEALSKLEKSLADATDNFNKLYEEKRKMLEERIDHYRNMLQQEKKAALQDAKKAAEDEKNYKAEREDKPDSSYTSDPAVREEQARKAERETNHAVENDNENELLSQNRDKFGSRLTVKSYTLDEIADTDNEDVSAEKKEKAKVVKYYVYLNKGNQQNGMHDNDRFMIIPASLYADVWKRANEFLATTKTNIKLSDLVRIRNSTEGLFNPSSLTMKNGRKIDTTYPHGNNKTVERIRSFFGEGRYDLIESAGFVPFAMSDDCIILQSKSLNNSNYGGEKGRSVDGTSLMTEVANNVRLAKQELSQLSDEYDKAKLLYNNAAEEERDSAYEKLNDLANQMKSARAKVNHYEKEKELLSKRESKGVDSTRDHYIIIDLSDRSTYLSLNTMAQTLQNRIKFKCDTALNEMNLEYCTTEELQNIMIEYLKKTEAVYQQENAKTEFADDYAPEEFDNMDMDQLLYVALNSNLMKSIDSENGGYSEADIRAMDSETLRAYLRYAANQNQEHTKSSKEDIYGYVKQMDRSSMIASIKPMVERTIRNEMVNDLFDRVPKSTVRTQKEAMKYIKDHGGMKRDHTKSEDEGAFTNLRVNDVYMVDPVIFLLNPEAIAQLAKEDREKVNRAIDNLYKQDKPHFIKSSGSKKKFDLDFINKNRTKMPNQFKAYGTTYLLTDIGDLHSVYISENMNGGIQDEAFEDGDILDPSDTTNSTFLPAVTYLENMINMITECASKGINPDAPCRVVYNTSKDGKSTNNHYLGYVYGSGKDAMRDVKSLDWLLANAYSIHVYGKDPRYGNIDFYLRNNSYGNGTMKYAAPIETLKSELKSAQKLLAGKVSGSANYTGFLKNYLVARLALVKRQMYDIATQYSNGGFTPDTIGALSDAYAALSKQRAYITELIERPNIESDNKNLKTIGDAARKLHEIVSNNKLFGASSPIVKACAATVEQAKKSGIDISEEQTSTDTAQTSSVDDAKLKLADKFLRQLRNRDKHFDTLDKVVTALASFSNEDRSNTKVNRAYQCLSLIQDDFVTTSMTDQEKIDYYAGRMEEAKMNDKDMKRSIEYEQRISDIITAHSINGTNEMTNEEIGSASEEVSPAIENQDDSVTNAEVQESEESVAENAASTEDSEAPNTPDEFFNPAEPEAIDSLADKDLQAELLADLNEEESDATYVSKPKEADEDADRAEKEVVYTQQSAREKSDDLLLQKDTIDKLQKDIERTIEEINVLYPVAKPYIDARKSYLDMLEKRKGMTYGSDEYRTISMQINSQYKAMRSMPESAKAAFDVHTDIENKNDLIKKRKELKDAYHKSMLDYTSNASLLDILSNGASYSYYHTKYAMNGVTPRQLARNVIKTMNELRDPVAGNITAVDDYTIAEALRRNISERELQYAENFRRIASQNITYWKRQLASLMYESAYMSYKLGNIDDDAMHNAQTEIEDYVSGIAFKSSDDAKGRSLYKARLEDEAKFAEKAFASIRSKYDSAAPDTITTDKLDQMNNPMYGAIPKLRSQIETATQAREYLFDMSAESIAKSISGEKGGRLPIPIMSAALGAILEASEGNLTGKNVKLNNVMNKYMTENGISEADQKAINDFFDNDMTWVDLAQKYPCTIQGNDVQVNPEYKRIRDIIVRIKPIRDALLGKGVDRKHILDRNLAIPDRVVDDYFGDYSPLMKKVFYTPVMKADDKIVVEKANYMKRLKEAGLSKKNSAAVAEAVDKGLSDSEIAPENLNAVQEVRKITEELYKLKNRAEVVNGLTITEHRENYIPHLSTEDDTLAHKLFGISSTLTSLPADLIGKTGDFQPISKFDPTKRERKGTDTKYDAVESMKRLLDGSLSAIYQSSNNVRLLQLSEAINELASEKNDSTDVKNRFGTFRMYNDNYSQYAADKKARLDRGVENATSRNAYALLRSIKAIRAMAIIGGNVKSAMSNSLVIGDVLSSDPVHFSAAFAQSFAAMFDTKQRGDYVSQNSNWLKARNPLGYDEISDNKVADAMYWLPGVIDKLAAQTAVRTFYAKYKALGWHDQLALEQAEERARRMMATKTRVARPSLYNSEVFSTAAQFSQESVNYLYYLAKDLKKYSGGSLPKAVMTALGMFLWHFVYNQALDTTTAMDPFGATKEAVTSWDSSANVGTNVLSGAKTVADEVNPFTNIMTDGLEGVPVVDGINSIFDLGTAMMQGEDPEDVLDYVGDMLSSWIPCGTQIKRTAQGIKSYAQGYAETSNGGISYPIEQNSPVKAAAMAVLGAGVSPEGQMARLKGTEALTPTSANVMKELIDNGIAPSSAYKSVVGTAIAKEDTSRSDKVSQVASNRQEIAGAAQTAQEARTGVEIPSDLIPSLAKKASDTASPVATGINLWRETGIKCYPSKITSASITLDGEKYVKNDAGQAIPLTDEDYEVINANYARAYSVYVTKYQNYEDATEAATNLKKEMDKARTVAVKSYVNQKEVADNGTNESR